MLRVTMLVVLVALFSPTTAVSNPLPNGVVGLYPDANASTRCLYDSETGELHVFVVHDRTAPFLDAMYLRFSAPKPECLHATYLYDIGGPGGAITSGNSQTGVEVSLLGCQPAPGAGHVMTIVYAATGQTPTDCWYDVLPDHLGRLEAVGCDMSPYEVVSSTALVNPSRPGLCVVATEETTWGQVKALYR